MDEDEALQRLADAADAAARALGWVPLKALVLMEVLTDDGEREVAMATSRDLRVQDSLGLLHFAVARENAGIVRDALDDSA